MVYRDLGQQRGSDELCFSQSLSLSLLTLNPKPLKLQMDGWIAVCTRTYRLAGDYPRAPM